MDIKKIRKNHSKWIHSEGKEGERANFSDAEVDGQDFSGMDLRGAYFRDASLLDSKFNGANLRGADFSGSDLRDSYFTGADLRGANFKDCDLRGVDFQGADLSGANLCHTCLDGVNFHFADIEDADLRMICCIHSSCIPLPTGRGLNIKVDKDLAAQIAYLLCSLSCDDPEFQKIREQLLPFANQYGKFCLVEKLK